MKSFNFPYLSFDPNAKSQLKLAIRNLKQALNLLQFVVMIRISVFIIICLVLQSCRTYSSPAHSNPWFSWRTLRQAEDELGVDFYELSCDKCVFSNETNVLVFYNNRRLAEIDGVSIWLNVAPEVVSDETKWRIATIDLDLISLALRATPCEESKTIKVMLDAGHGGSDPGAVSCCGTVKEKEINLDLVLKTGKLLKKAGFEVCYTRKCDRDISLSGRSRAATRQKADLFVSVHVNKAANTNACGVETFVLTPSGYPGTAANSPPRGWQIGNKNDYNSNLLGYCLQCSLSGNGEQPERGLKRQSFFVLRETYCPASLVELGFLSNADDLKKLRCPEWRQNCAQLLADGISDYCRRVESLDKAVAEMRRKRSQANQRWCEHLADHANNRVQSPERAAAIDSKRKGQAAASESTGQTDAIPALSALRQESVTTNNLNNAEIQLDTESAQNADEMEILMDFYDKGSFETL